MIKIKRRKFRPTKARDPNEAWLKKHYRSMVNHHAGQYLILAEGEPFIGYDAAELERQAGTKHPGVITRGMPIPHPEDFISVLSFKSIA